MTTFAELRAARPAVWLHTCATLRTFAGHLTDHAAEARGVPLRLHASWRGPAATAARAQLERLGDGVASLAPPMLAADQVLAEYATEVTHAQRRLADLVAELASHGVGITESGHLDGVEPAAVGAAGARLAELLALADGAQTDAVRRLRDLLAAFDASAVPGPVPDPAPGQIPAPGTDPAAVRRWWTGLTESQRRWLEVHNGTRIGSLDGVPTDVRDQVNRITLAGLPGLDALKARLAGDEPVRAYLLALDVPAGRVVVAAGDPDRSANVLTYVPGTGESFASLGRLLQRADRMAVHADAPGGSTAVVVWLGYPAPPNLVAAAAPGAAQRGEAALGRFAAGVRDTHEAGPLHETVLGHSYGSLVVGLAAHDRRLSADDLVFVGSPGVGVDRAAELNMPAGHVWSSTATYDPIRMLYAGAGVRDPFVFGRTGPADSQWFGTDPSAPRFGAHVFTAEPGDPRHPVDVHSAYFDEGNPALDDIARIARGDGGQVR